MKETTPTGNGKGPVCYECGAEMEGKWNTGYHKYSCGNIKVIRDGDHWMEACLVKGVSNGKT